MSRLRVLQERLALQQEKALNGDPHPDAPEGDKGEAARQWDRVAEKTRNALLEEAHKAGFSAVSFPGLYAVFTRPDGSEVHDPD